SAATTSRPCAGRDAVHAAQHRVYRSQPDDDIPAKELALGFDSGNQMITHAMKARRRLLGLLDS
ncbi:MAG: hypothetical protein Q4E00_10780, partial [Actinomyces bowdenii]|nr:hypothetical protein [Actinomyces bowdenii]